MNPSLIEKLMAAGKDPTQYWMEVPLEQPLPDETVPKDTMTLSDHISEMSDLILNSSNDEVLMFISDVLKFKGL